MFAYLFRCSRRVISFIFLLVSRDVERVSSGLSSPPKIGNHKKHDFFLFCCDFVESLKNINDIWLKVMNCLTAAEHVLVSEAHEWLHMLFAVVQWKAKLVSMIQWNPCMSIIIAICYRGLFSLGAVFRGNTPLPRGPNECDSS